MIPEKALCCCDQCKAQSCLVAALKLPPEVQKIINFDALVAAVFPHVKEMKKCFCGPMWKDHHPFRHVQTCPLYQSTKKKKTPYNQKENAEALLTILRNAHADQYNGLDDDMPDNCNDWISNLTDDEVADICISVFREGI